MERVRGIEPLSSAWKAVIIPLYDTRLITILLTLKTAENKTAV